MEPGYEFFDHTADMGIRVWAATREGLIEPAGEGLYAAIGELALVQDCEPFTASLDAGDPAELLRDYLNLLLFTFERRQRAVKSPRVNEYNRRRLSVTGDAVLVDNDRTVYHHEVKAITYHGLSIREIPGGYEAMVIVDI